MDFNSLALLFHPSLDWIQVEITTHHQSPGPYSLFRAYERQWIQEHMPLDLFLEFRPGMRKARLVHLQGWGEPLLHPRFSEMLRIAREACPRVATATHLSKLDEGQVQELVQGGLSTLTLHVTGPRIDEKSPGTELGDLIQTLDTLIRVKSRKNTELPAIYVLCTLTRSGLENLARLPGILAHSGVSLLIVNPLTIAVLPEFEEETLTPANDQEYEELRGRLLEVKERCLHAGLGMHFFLINGGREPRCCIEQPHRSVFAGVRGGIAPCVFCALPVDGKADYKFQGLEMEFPQMSFGNIRDGRVWRNREYRAFRREFAHGRLPEFCQGCWRPYLVAE